MDYQKIADLTMHTGGVTITKYGDTFSPNYGYAVGGHDGSYIKLSGENPDLIGPALQITMREFPDYLIGTWFDGTNIYIDPILFISNRKDALALGKRYNQKAIYDFGLGTTIEVPE